MQTTVSPALQAAALSGDHAAPASEPFDRRAPFVACAAVLAIHGAFLTACFLSAGKFEAAALERHVPDDTYYYLQVANHIVDGHGSVFSIGKPTNGYHPLWMAVLVALQSCAHWSRDAFTIAAAWFGSLATALAAFPLLRLLRRAGLPSHAATLAAVVALANPWMTVLATNGMESGLYSLLLIALICVSGGASPVGKGAAIAHGVCAGLLMLARTDAVVIAACLYLFLLVTRRRSLGWLVLSGMVASLVVAPWLAWNAAKFGTIMQSSADAIPAMIRGTLDGSWSMRFEYGKNTLLIILYDLLVYPLVRFTSHEQPARTAVLIGAVLGIAALVAWRRRSLRPGTVCPAWLGLGVLLLITYEAFGRLWLQTWHLTHLTLATSLALAAAIATLPRAVRTLASVALLALAVTAYDKGFWITQPGIIAGSKAFAAAPRDRLKIGHTDCGALAFFGTDEVVNLDGVVNNEVVPFVRSGTLADYCFREGFDQVHITDDRWKITNHGVRSMVVDVQPTAATVSADLLGGLESFRMEPAGSITLQGWIGGKGKDPFASYPLIELLGADGKHLRTIRAQRVPRPDLAARDQALAHVGFTAQIDGVGDLPAALHVRLGCMTRDGVAWKAAPEN